MVTLLHGWDMTEVSVLWPGSEVFKGESWIRIHANRTSWFERQKTQYTFRGVVLES